MIKCIAIDDEPLALRQLSKYMERISDLEVVALCNSAHTAEQVLAEVSGRVPVPGIGEKA